MAEISGPYWEFEALLRHAERLLPNAMIKQRISQLIASTAGLTHLELTIATQTTSGEFVLDLHIGPQYAPTENNNT